MDNEKLESFYNAQAAQYFDKGIFSEWSWKCKHCDNTFTTSNSKKMPSFCECKHREFEPAVLQKIGKPPINFFPEIKTILENPLNFVLAELQNHFKGEEEAAKAIFLSCIMAKVKNAQPTSSNLLINSESGAGKDYIAGAIVGLFDQNQAFTRSRISATALNYWHQNEAEWTWNEKILFLADISSGILNCDAFKAMASGQNSCTITEKGKTLDIEILGKPALILTSAYPNPAHELLRRFPIVSLNESNEQTKAILKYHGKKSISAEKNEYNQRLRLALDYLEPYLVLIKFADFLSENFPAVIMARTAFPRLLDLIKAAAVLNQFSRQKETIDDKVYLIAEKQDYELAKEIFLQTCANASLLPLTHRQKKVIAFFKGKTGERFSFNELRDVALFSAIPERSLRRELEKLVGFGLLTANTERVEGSIRPVQYYEFKGVSSLNLPEWKEIETFWQNRQNGTTELFGIIDKLAEREKSKVLIQSAQSARCAIANRLQEKRIELDGATSAITEKNTKLSDKTFATTENSDLSHCELCGLPAPARFSFALNGQMKQVCRVCIEKERGLVPNAKQV